jgi:hypothetical protein
MKLKGALVGVGAGAFIFVLGVLDLRHVRQAWEHTTFHPDYEMNGPSTLILLGLLIMVAFAIAGLVGRLRGRTK